MSNYTGLYRGAVQDIDDPEDRGRLRLLIPAVMGDAITGWAEPSLPSKKLPRWSVGDRVWAIFEDGDLNRPVYLARQVVHTEDLGFELPPATILPQWEDNDTRTATSGEIAQGFFTHRLLHRDIVHYEFIPFVNGVAIDRSKYTLDTATGHITLTLEGWETTSDKFRFIYAYYSEQPPLVQVPYTVLGSVPKWRYGTSTALPTGTQVGDLLCVAITGTAPEATNLTDSRLVKRWTSNAFGSIWGTAYTSVYTGSADTLASLTYPDIASGSHDRVGMMIAIHPNSPITWDSRLSALTNPSVGGAGVIPALGGEGSGAIVAVGAGGGIGGAYGTYNWPASWAGIDEFNNSYQSVQMAKTTDLTPTALSAVWTDSADSWVGCAVGLGLG